ncbi:MAG: glycoside hydrolase family 30 protein [Flavobacterium sp.]|nr:glycoside hydrolase family 30 protein [Flavobacterium sp.]
MKNNFKIVLVIIFLSTVTFGQTENINNQSINFLEIYTTADNTDLRLSKQSNIIFVNANQPLETETCVFVNPDKTFQNFIGIGGAITDASAEVYSKLSVSKKQELMNAYYNNEIGIGYSLIRTTIHSCDFSSDSYEYVSDNNKNLRTFNIDHDQKFRLPMIKEAIKTANGKLLIYASPWSPPAFMKSNHSMLKGGTLLPEYQQTWADYFSKFIKAYQKEGVPIWGVTIQNEPMATQKWESCIFTAEAERDFLKNFLGPTLKKDGLGDKKIVVWDHNRDLVNQRTAVIFDDPVAAKYAWGIGFHWYETWTGGLPMFENIAKLNEAYPNKKILFTEGCVESFDQKKYQFWANAERYGLSMINDFNNGTVGWTDWNILLDEKGGPNHVGNFCFAPIHADLNSDEIIYTPSYYYIGHFSKFIRPDAKRISTSASRSNLSSTSFLNKNKKIVTIVMNKSDQKITYDLYLKFKKATIEIPAHAIQTLVYKKI